LNLRFIIKHLSVNRLLNFIRIYFSFHLSKLFKINFQFGFPISVSIEPTTSCNLRCPECPSGLRSFKRETGMLEVELFNQIIEQIHKKTTYLTFYFQGEPYLNTNFLEMVKIAVNKNLFTSTSTNGHYLNHENIMKTIESGLHQLIISIDGTTQEIYEQYRIGGNLSKVIEGTKNLINQKKIHKSKTPNIIFQFLVVEPNEHQIKDIEILAEEIGVDELRFKTAQIYNYENGNKLIPKNEKYSRYKKGKNGKWKIKNDYKNECWRMWSSCVITWDGKIVPCCFDKDAKYNMGSITKKTLSEIWKSKEYNSFRKKLLKTRKEIDICKNCSEGTTIHI
jgi:radical SAM protein with 4Fe4S-binding SPASM domain